MQRFFATGQDTSGNAIPSVTVTVNLTGTATLATLFSDNAFTPLANPFTSNTDGTYQFYARNGRYDVVLTKTAHTFTASETTDVLLDDDFSVVSPAQITASQNDYAPTNGTNAAIWRINSDTIRSITGIAAPTANAGQRLLTLINTGSFNINLSNASASSAAGNKFTCANGRDYALFPNEPVQLVYDTSSAVWRVPYQGSRVLTKSGPGTIVSNSAALTTVFTYTVPGGILGTTSKIRVTVLGIYTNTTGGNDTLVPRLVYTGINNTGVTITVQNGITNGSIVIVGEVVASGATTTGESVIYDFQNSSTGVIFSNRATAATDTTIDETLNVQVTLGTASNNLTYTPRHSIVEWLP